MSVRAKFQVTTITRQSGGRYVGGVWEQCEVRSVRLCPVSGGSEENLKFFAASPSGSIEIGIANLEAVREFDIGKEFYVDFTAAPDSK